MKRFQSRLAIYKIHNDFAHVKYVLGLPLSCSGRSFRFTLASLRSSQGVSLQYLSQNPSVNLIPFPPNLDFLNYQDSNFILSFLHFYVTSTSMNSNQNLLKSVDKMLISPNLAGNNPD